MSTETKSQTHNIGEKAYNFMPLTRGMKKAYSYWITARAREDAIDMEMAMRKRARKIRERLIEDNQLAALGDDSNEVLSELDKEQMAADIRDLEAAASHQTDSFNDKKTAGRLHFSGEVCVDSLRTAEGTAKLMHLMLNANHKELTLDDVIDLYEKHTHQCIDAVREVMGIKKKQPAPQKSTEEPADSITPS